MAFKRVVVLGGGPIGLFCAIEAAQVFNSMFSKVTLVEMRAADYSRMNVPVLPGPVLKHLGTLGVKDQAVGKSMNAPLGQVESAVYTKAKNSGVKMKEGWVAVDLAGKEKRADGRYKDVSITLGEWDPKTRTTTARRDMISADLLIVAIGGGGIEGDLYRKKLGFETTTLGASNFAVYGVYDKVDTQGGLGNQLQGQLNSIAMTTRVETDNSQYLLLTLKKASPSDFAILKSNSDKLKQCMETTGRAFNSQLMGVLNDNAKAVGAFEIKIKRVGHSISPWFPAVLVGDAAVTPHPQTGTGLLTGFHGFEALQDLLKALKATNRSSDEAADAFCKFEDSYEVYLSAKAIEGTIVILKHLVGLVEAYQAQCDEDFRRAKGSEAKYLISFNGIGANLLKVKMESQIARALRFGRMLHDDTVRLDTAAGRKPRKLGDLSGTIEGNMDKYDASGNPVGNDSIKKLWGDIAGTYQQIVTLTARYNPLQDALGKLSAQMRT